MWFGKVLLGCVASLLVGCPTGEPDSGAGSADGPSVTWLQIETSYPGVEDPQVTQSIVVAPPGDYCAGVQAAQAAKDAHWDRVSTEGDSCDALAELVEAENSAVGEFHEPGSTLLGLGFASDDPGDLLAGDYVVGAPGELGTLTVTSSEVLVNQYAEKAAAIDLEQPGCYSEGFVASEPFERRMAEEGSATVMEDSASTRSFSFEGVLSLFGGADPINVTASGVASHCLLVVIYEEGQLPGR